VQLPAYLSGLAAIPVMALLVRRLTGSDGLAILGGGLTALNPLLAHYSVYVKQYSLDFLITAVILLVAVSVLERAEVRAGHLGGVVLLSASALLFSVGSVFVSAPVVGVVAFRAWMSRKRGAAGIVVLSAAFLLVLVGGFYLFRTQSRTLRAGWFHHAFFERSFSPRAIWTFVVNNQRSVEISLPSWSATEPWNPQTVSWTLPFVGLGLVWLFARRSTRPIGWSIVGFLAVFASAMFLGLYPLTSDRRTIFSFPVFITLAVMGVHAVTERVSRREDVRLAIGVAAALFALYAPIHVVYWNVNDKQMVDRVSRVDSADGLILSPDGVYLAGYYGPWDIAVSERGTREIDAVNIVRNLTAVAATKERVQQFLSRIRPGRVWYMAYRASPEENGNVLEAMQERGYDVQPVENTTKAVLYLGTLK
jgi:hypothetical protein